jgi:uncharacterized RDD family membrane protein YckC
VDPVTARAADLPKDDLSPLADPGARLGAVVIDTVLPSIPHVLGMPLGVALGSPATIHGFFWLGWVAVAALSIVDLVLLARYGQTIGKRVLGLRIVRADGARCSLARLFWARSVLPALVSWVPIAGQIFGLADAVAIFTERRRTLHDRLADTIVVDLRAPLPEPRGAAARKPR